jgi:hypothetical protein
MPAMSAPVSGSFELGLFVAELPSTDAGAVVLEAGATDDGTGLDPYPVWAKATEGTTTTDPTAIADAATQRRIFIKVPSRTKHTIRLLPRS